MTDTTPSDCALPGKSEQVPGAHPKFAVTPKWQSRSFLLTVASRATGIVTAIFAIIAYEFGKKDPGLSTLIVGLGAAIGVWLNGLAGSATRDVAINAGAQASLLSEPPPMGKVPPEFQRKV